MKKKERWICILLAAALSVCALAGCGKGTEDPGVEESSRSEAMGTPGGEGGAGGAKGRFVESDVQFPEEITNVRCIGKRSDGGITVLADNGGAGKTWLFLTTDAGETWTSQEAQLSLADSWISGSAVAPDGSVWLSGSFEGVDGTRVRKINPDGSVEEKTVTLPVMQDRDADNVIMQMGIDEAGRIFVEDLNGNILEMDPETGDCAKSIDYGDEYVRYFGIAGEKLLTVSESGIRVSDTANKTVLPDDAVLDELIRADASLMSSDSEGIFPLVFTAGTEKGSIVHADSSGIYYHRDGAAVSEQLVNGALGSMGSLSLIQIVMTDEENFLLHCRDTSGSKVLRYHYDKEVSALPETELTIYALQDSSLLRQAATLYQKENSGVFVTIKIGMTGDDGVTAEDAVSALNTEIMAGNVPDVIILDGLPEDSYIEKGLLADIRGIVEEVEQEDGLFSNVKDAYGRDGKMYGIPARFYPVVVIGTQETVAAGGSVTEFADYIGRLAEENPGKRATSDLSAQGVLWTLFRADSANWLAADKTLDEERLTKWLTAAKKIYDANPEKTEHKFYTQFDNTLYGTSGTGAFEIMSGEAMSGYGTLVDLVGLETILAAAEQTGADYGLLGGAETKCFVPHLQAGISSASDAPEAAAAFLKVLLGKECGSIDESGFPVNRAGWAAVCEDKIKMYGSDSEISIGTSDADGQGMEFILNDLNQDVVDKLTALLESLTAPALTDSTIEDVVTAQGEAYLKGELPLEEAVAAIRQKISIYLAE